MRTDLIASLLVHARHTAQPIVVPEKTAIKTDVVAYRVQDKVFAKLWPGAHPLAWKAGGPSDKVEPTASPIAPELVLKNPARVSAKALGLVGVEGEVGFRLAKDLPSRDKAYGEEEIAAAIAEAVVTIEICASRIAKWKTAPGSWQLADFQNHGSLVVGSGTKDWRKIDFRKQSMEIRVGARVSKATGSHSFGDPFRLMPWIVAHCAERTGGLRKGDVVTTGAWTGLEAAKAGDEVVVIFPGIGEARLRIE